MSEVKEPQFHVDWFSRNIPTWEKYLAPFKGVPYMNALEVGSWEGRSTCWLLQNILTDDTSRMTCIDTFQGNPENVHQGYEKDVEDVFRENIEIIGAAEKVDLKQMPSRFALKYLHEQSFNIIYLDGSHITADVLSDIVLAWPLLKHGGVMIMDDYEYCVPSMEAKPKFAIDAFQAIHRKELYELHRGWQMIWRKI